MIVRSFLSIFIRIIMTLFRKNKMNNQVKKQNNNLEEYLNYYCNIDKPGYAVLVTGAWGVGKTFQVKKILPDNKAYYISLFGHKSADDIISSVFVAMHPNKTMIKKATEKIEDISSKIPGIGSLGINVLTSSLVGAFLRHEVNTDKPLIFDDLERCGLNPKVLLGIINLYIEHHGCKVIVIANDGELKENFTKSKEKLFGHTIKLSSDINSAFNAFIKLIAEKNEKQILESNRKTITDTFIKSEVKSLRILKYLLFDLARLLKCLRQDQLENAKELTEIFMLFSALHIELNSGRLSQKDLFDRQKSSTDHILTKDKEELNKPVPQIVKSDLLYQGIRLTDTLLNDNSLREMFVDGVFKPETIQSSLDVNRIFRKEIISRPWWSVLNFESLEDEIVNNSFNQMNLEFKNREITDSGDILHVFALKLFMSNKNIPSKSIDNVATECMEYIDDLDKLEKLLPDDFSGQWYWDLEQSAHGFSYWLQDDYKENFSQLYKHLTSSIECAYIKSLRKQSPELLGLMQYDAMKFKKLICSNINEICLYATVPVLTWLDPTEFVDAWMRAPNENWYWISVALRDRNYHDTSSDSNPEADWLKEITKNLYSEASIKEGFARLRIIRTIELSQGKYKNTSPPRTQ